MDIENLTEQARRLEQAENWREALRLYVEVVEERGRRGTPDATLLSRVGDLHIRTDDIEAAVKRWEQAIETHLLEGQSDNALAVCRKIVRYSPEREEIYLRMGQIRARQGLLIYARKHFLTYAEMVGMRGDQAEALRAMEELVSWVPSDLETRLFLAERMVEEGRREKALVYLREGYWRALWERNREALDQIRPRILELDPGAELGLLPVEEGEGADTAQGVTGAKVGAEEARRAEGGVWARILDKELKRRKASEEEAQARVEETGLREEEARQREEAVRLEASPPKASPSREEEDTVGPASAPADGAPARDEPHLPHVDLGALILDESVGRKGAGAPPAATPGSDFTQLLSRFKEKTAHRPDEMEAQGHYDLGVANREMGLLDDAIVLFEKALQADSDHLPAFEMLGRCHLDKGEPVAALEKMGPSLELPVQVEDDLLGIYYFMGRACEELGRIDEARDWYDRVFTLDINFLDVTARMRELR
jgi:tetratricopeptide (TPR) repeat protein